MDTLTCYERIQAAWNLKPADRVPCSPLVIYILPYQAGMSFKEMVEDPERLVQAAIDHADLIGDDLHPVMTILDHQSVLPNAAWDQTTLDWRIYENFPPAGNVPSAYFDKVMIGDFDDLMERGMAPILFNRGIHSSVFERSLEEHLYYGFEYPQVFMDAWRRFVEETGKALMFGARALIPFDYLISYRTFPGIVEDVLERPEKLKKACEIVGEYEIMRAMRKCMVAGAGTVPGAEIIFLGNGMGGPPYVSPAVFAEFGYPTLKMQVDMAVKRGFKVHVHLDGEFTGALDTLGHLGDGLPRGTVLIDLEKTNMRRAKEALGDRLCLYGAVPSALQVYGSPDEIDAYCRKLIEDCGEGGGFILGTECEVPWDAKPENVRAMIAAAEKYGRYTKPATEFAGSQERLLARVREGLTPPTEEELDSVTARFLFGEHAERMMRHAPWSFLLTKLMWKQGEEPWSRLGGPN